MMIRSLGAKVLYRASGGISRMALMARECEKNEGRDTILYRVISLCHSILASSYIDN